MSVAEIKKQIQEKVEYLDDEQFLLQLLTVINDKELQELDAAKNIEKVFEKYDGLLKRLA